MAYQALYRKWRPMVFDDVIGQSHITNTLKNEIIENRLAHAYIFTGTRGTGKTSTAKILSRAVNCPDVKDGNPCNKCEICKGIMSSAILDIIEIDAASNTGVDNIREIIEQCQYASASTKYKVYIIDEVHMLSTGAFNALLKTLEEPPSHVIFILATTEIHMVPATILSRCQRFDFSTISAEDIVLAMKRILENESIVVENDALEYVAYLGNGSMRDSLSILDRCIAFKNSGISYTDVVDIVGALDDTYLYEFAQHIATNNIGLLISSFDKCVVSGKSLDNFASDMLNCYREMLKFTVIGKEYKTSSKRYNLITKTVDLYTQEKIIRCIYILTDLIHDLKFVANPRVLIECTLIKMANPSFESGEAALLDRIAELEKKVGSVKFAEYANADEQPQIISQEEYPLYEEIPPDVNDYNDMSTELKKEHLTDATSPSSNSKTPELVSPYTDIINNWSEIVSEVMNEKLLTLYLHINNAEPRVCKNGIVILFDDDNTKNSFDKTSEKSKLCEIIKQVTGKDVNIKCMLKNEALYDNENDAVSENDIFANLVAHSDDFPDNIKLD